MDETNSARKSEMLELKRDLMAVYSDLYVRMNELNRKNSAINKLFLKTSLCLEKVLVYENKIIYDEKSLQNAKKQKLK